MRVANESAYHHRNWTSRQRANVLHPRHENQAALSQELDQMQGAGHRVLFIYEIVMEQDAAMGRFESPVEYPSDDKRPYGVFTGVRKAYLVWAISTIVIVIIGVAAVIVVYFLGA